MSNYIYRNSIAISEACATFMSKVYRWMTIGIGTSSVIAYTVGNNTKFVQSVIMNRALFWGMIMAQFSAVFILSLSINRLNSFVASLVYLGYAALTGMTLSSIFLAYDNHSIYLIFGLTAFAYAGLSVFGFTTKRDLGPIGLFCTMGLFGIAGLAIVLMIFPNVMGGIAGPVYSLAGLIVFSGLTAYDTHKIKALNILEPGSEEESKGAIIGALTLYLDFINLFLFMLRSIGRRK